MLWLVAYNYVIVQTFVRVTSQETSKLWSHTLKILYISRLSASFCFESLSGSATTYLSDLLHLYTPSRQPRSSADTRVLRIPPFRTRFSGQRSFSCQASTTWNQLPSSIRHASSVSSFKSSLKTILFSRTSWAPLPWGARVCQGVCLCVDGCVCVCVRAHACMCLLFVYLNFCRLDICLC